MKTINYITKNFAMTFRRVNVIAYVTIMLAISTIAEAQTPPYYNFVPTGGANSFPFNINAATGKKVQWKLQPGDFVLPSAAPSGNLITNLWVYKAASTANTVTYNTLTIKFAAVASTTYFTIGTWYSGTMTTARSVDLK